MFLFLANFDKTNAWGNFGSPIKYNFLKPLSKANVDKASETLWAPYMMTLVNA